MVTPRGAMRIVWGDPVDSSVVSIDRRNRVGDDACRDTRVDVSMIEWYTRGTRIRMSVWFPALMIAMLSWDTSGTAAVCLSAAVLHELGHCAAMWRCRDLPQSITFGIFGIRVERCTQTLGYAALCRIALAGPLTNIGCAVVAAVLGWTDAAAIHAVCGGLHLLPIVSLDGGEALYALLCRYMEEAQAERWLLIVSAVVVFPLSVLGFLVLLADGYNFTLLILSGYLILRMFLRAEH